MRKREEEKQQRRDTIIKTIASNQSRQVNADILPAPDVDGVEVKQ